MTKWIREIQNLQEKPVQLDRISDLWVRAFIMPFSIRGGDPFERKSTGGVFTSSLSNIVNTTIFEGIHGASPLQVSVWPIPSNGMIKEFRPLGAVASLDLTSLQKGVYILRITTESGIVYHKIIIQR